MKVRTTLIVSEELMRELKRLAGVHGKTLSAVVEETLRRGLAPADRDLAPLPTHRMGRPRVDVADRNTVRGVMEER